MLGVSWADFITSEEIVQRMFKNREILFSIIILVFWAYYSRRQISTPVARKKPQKKIKRTLQDIVVLWTYISRTFQSTALKIRITMMVANLICFLIRMMSDLFV